RSIGIQPDVIIARADYPVDDALCEKIALFCDVDRRAVVPLVTTPLLYEIPLILEDAGLGDFVVERLGLDVDPPDLDEWRELVERIRAPKSSLPIAIVGKYVELHDAYISVREALYHAALAHGWDVDVHYISSETLERGRGWDELEKVIGVVVPGGFGERGVEGKIVTARWARENNVPYLGLCLGLQVIIIELARHALDNEEANSTEFDPHTRYPVIDLMADQRTIVDMGGTMRLGLYPCQLVPGTKAAAAYGVPDVEERHRHRFEVNNAYRDLLTEAGLVFGGLSPDGRLIEIVELADHPFMVGCQFHPEFKSRPTRPHPLFSAFVASVIARYETET
ncbi:MAG: CTP synthase, partial [Anaerolineae bacterium]